MSTARAAPTPSDYPAILASYIRSHSEDALYQASLLSNCCIESGLGPEDIVAMHFEALDQLMAVMSPRQQSRTVADAHQFLLEMMIAYGVRYKDYLELRLSQTMRDAESRALRDRERVLEAERLQQEKEDILAMIAHELRNPISAAKGNVDVAERYLASGQVTLVPRQLGAARVALDRLSRLSADLVESSRGAQPELTRGPVALKTIVEQSCAWVQAAAAAKGIELIVEPGDEVHLVASADALLTAFGNLLSNAIRYTPPGGRVRILRRRDGDTAVVEVHDTGIGISPTALARIFEKFYRAEEARRVEAHGLGLGLSLAQQMIIAHDGRIEAESTPGSGSIFRVVLPIKQAAPLQE